jgi:hypothetical protein
MTLLDPHQARYARVMKSDKNKNPPLEYERGIMRKNRNKPTLSAREEG